MKLLANKRGQALSGLQAFLMGLAGVTVILVVVLIVLTELQTAALTSAGATTIASNATATIITKMVSIPTWIGIIIVVAMAFLVLSFFLNKAQ